MGNALVHMCCMLFVAYFESKHFFLILANGTFIKNKSAPLKLEGSCAGYGFGARLPGICLSSSSLCFSYIKRPADLSGLV